MRSWRNALVLALVSAGSGCGDEGEARSEECAQSALTYQTFGEAFLASWCRGCHSRELPEDMRQLAPLAVNFNTLEEVQARAGRIEFLVVEGKTMPPAGGPSTEERALMGEWLRCGARE
jgi:uncharacterized membrane protein